MQYLFSQPSKISHYRDDFVKKCDAFIGFTQQATVA